MNSMAEAPITVRDESTIFDRVFAPVCTSSIILRIMMICIMSLLSASPGSAAPYSKAPAECTSIYHSQAFQNGYKVSIRFTLADLQQLSP
jgi:hypothetical protein